MSGNTQMSGFLTQEELTRLLPTGHPVAYGTGTILVREGDKSDFVLYLRQGHIKAVVGEPKSIAYIFSPGSIVGELAAMTEQPRTADLIALNDVEAHVIPGAAWMEFLMSEPRANLAMLKHLAGRIVAKDLPEVESATTSEHKIAKGLVRLIDAGMGQETGDGIRITGVTQRDLGSLSGLSRETAAVVLRRMREAGTVATARGSLLIRDPEAIERLIQRDDRRHLTHDAGRYQYAPGRRARHRLGPPPR
ncbi:Crp/Fnr family transcriptional regulator [Glycomyces sp. NPDC046736]|uniref:Crp/Fnr family transcriptional regulator n=1 Tax=Glycomyces sp. NPDC046736 TaxID=3155615 RepID=UPI0033FE0970